MDKALLIKFKERLLKEKNNLANQLSGVSVLNPNNPFDWEPIPGERESNTADPNDYADSIEQFEENTALVNELEVELKSVSEALEKIDSQKYGICEECGELIEVERLEANPSARTCLKDKNK